MKMTGSVSYKKTAPQRRVKSAKPMVPFVDLQAQYTQLAREVDGGIKDVLKNCDFILGSRVAEFESDFARYCDAKHAVGVGSGTEALHLALRSLGIGEGDDVITQANTFIATPLSITNAGARPVFVDVDPDTYGIDPKQVELAITERTRAIMPVHIYGQCAPMDELGSIAAKYGLYIIEDACQAHGAYHHGSDGLRRAGSIGNAAAFSFYPGKNLGAYGDGGMVTTNAKTVYDRVKMLRDYGQSVKYHHRFKGYNSRLDSIQAAVLDVKLNYLDKWNALRVSHAKRYTELLSDIPELKLPLFDPDKGFSHVFHLYVVRAEERDALRDFLTEKNISCGIHYPIPCHLQEAFSDLGYTEGIFPVTEQTAAEILSLPMFPELKDEQICFVVEAIREFYGH